MTKLQGQLLKLFCKIISLIRKRRHTKIKNSFSKSSFFDILKKYLQVHYRFNRNRIFSVKSLINLDVFRHRNGFSNWWGKAQKFTDDEWMKYFKMRKQTFNLLVNQIKPFIHNSNTKCMPLGKQVALTVIALSSGKRYEYLGNLFCISKSNLKHIIYDICIAITHLMPNYLRTPNQEHTEKIIEEFKSLWGFPQCAGVLGSMHIPLKKSKLPINATDYINSNFDYSILFQGIVDATYKFWDINIGWPGSVPECRVLTNSTLWFKGQDRKLFPESIQNHSGIDVPIYILAGASYPLSHWVLRPFLNDSPSKREIVFNKKFTFAYNACEIALKRLKARWQCLASRNIKSYEMLPTVVSACCILHNICEINKEPILDEWVVKAESNFKQPAPTVCSSVIGPQAENIRYVVCDYLMQS